MKIFALDHNSFGIEHVAFALKQMGHSVNVEKHIIDDPRYSTEFDGFFEKKIVGRYDVFFSFNFFPVVSDNCNKHGIKYVSWIYDSPHVALFSYKILNPCNYVFIFDKEMYLELKNAGISTVYYMPLAAEAAIYDEFIPTPEIVKNYSCDVSFVGALYNEAHCLYDRFDVLPDYTKGYLDAVVQAQSRIYGYFFLQEMLKPSIMEEIQKHIPYTPNRDGVESAEYIFAHYFMARKVTEIERHDIIKKVSGNFNMKIYTTGNTSDFPDIMNMGPVDYYDMMPYIFKCSKINLNISLKSIRSGIPLRAFDIMACGGFLVSNYQADFLDYFVPGEDLILFQDSDELIALIDYYLAHEDERLQIAGNGYNKVKLYHGFRCRLQEIFNIIEQS